MLDAPLLQRTQLSKGVRAEFEVFIKLVKLVGGEAGAKAMGNPFGHGATSTRTCPRTSRSTSSPT